MVDIAIISLYFERPFWELFDSYLIIMSYWVYTPLLKRKCFGLREKWYDGSSLRANYNFNQFFLTPEQLQVCPVWAVENQLVLNSLQFTNSPTWYLSNFTYAILPTKIYTKTSYLTKMYIKILPDCSRYYPLKLTR